MAFNPTADELDSKLQADGHKTLRLSRDTLVVTDIDGPEALNHITATARSYGADVDHTIPADQVRLQF